MPSSKPALSLCMIVRDEAEMLPGCLKSVQAAVDEIVAVDTGSKDDTPRIAAAHGAKVCRHEWRDDFSEARNASLKHATGLWVLWMDADERLRPSEHPRLRRALTREAVGAYLVPVLSTTPTGSQVTHGHRLFRNDPRIQFSGRIHEQISPAIARVRARIGRADFTIEHLGYNIPEDQLRGKYTRNLRLLTMAKEREPRDAYIRFKLAQAHLLAMEALFEGEESKIYNLGNSKGYSVHEVIQLARQITGHAIPAIEADIRPGDPAVLIAGSDKIRRELGWKPVYEDLAAILQTAWDWHRAERPL